MMQQNTPQWLEWRKKKIGASDAPVIMNISPWCTPYQLWLEKLDLAEPKEMTPAMQRGLDLQDLALDEFKKITGLSMFPEIRTHPQHEWMIASLDGITLDGQHIVEVKCPGEKNHSIALSGKVPDCYVPQLQHQMEVCGHEHMYYFSFDGTSGVVLNVYRNEGYCKELIYNELKFYECLQSGFPPEFGKDDFMERSDSEWLTIEQEWTECQQRLKELETTEEQLRKKLIEMSNGKNCMGSKIRLQQYVRVGNIDYSKIEQLKDIDLTPYRKKQSISWRISHV